MKRNITIGVLFVVIAIGILGAWFTCREPTDAELRLLSEQKADVLERLVKMVEEDDQAVSYISVGDVHNSKINPERQNEYQRLLTKLGRNAVLRHGLHQTWVIIDRHGSFVSFRSVKGLLYLPRQFREGYSVRQSLDNAPPKTPNTIYITPINDMWCIAKQYL